MIKWEYRILVGYEDLHDELNKLGQEGWEAWTLDSFGSCGSTIVQLKRRIEE